MKISRRSFIAGASFAALICGNPRLSKAGLLHGSAAATEKSVLNLAHPADIPFKNLFLTSTGSVNPSVQSANGMPTSNSFTGGNFTAVVLPSNYFGKFRISWKGSMSLTAPNIVTVNPSAGSQSNVRNNIIFEGVLPAAPNNFVEFDFSNPITSITDSGIPSSAGGTMILVTSGFHGLGTTFQVQITGAGGGANGTWTANQITTTTSVLVGSTFTSTAGAAGRINFAFGPGIWAYNAGSSTFAGFDGLVLCMSETSPSGTDHSGDLADVLSGDVNRMFNQDFINLYKALNPGIIRQLDNAGINSSMISQYKYTNPGPINSSNLGRVSYLQDLYLPDTLVASGGAITSSPSGVVYSCSAATSTPGTWTDGEVFQGFLDAAPIGYNMLGITQGASNGAGGFFIRVALSSGDVTSLTGVTRVVVNGFGQGGYVPGAGSGTGNWGINIIDATHIDLTTDKAGNPSVYVSNHGAGGYISACTINCGARGAKLLIGQVGLTPGFSNGSSNGSGFSVNGYVTCVYTAILDAVIISPAGINSHWPLSVRVALCNKLNAHYWHHFPYLYDMAAATEATQANCIAEINYIKANLNPNLHCYFELGNEMGWNPGFHQAGFYYYSGLCLSSSTTQFLSMIPLRTRLVFGAVGNTWSPRGGMVRVFPWQTVGLTAGQISGLYNGIGLVGATYPLYVSAGYADYNVAPNRPIDKTEAIGCAPYYSGGVIQPHGIYTLAYNALDLQGMIDAADNYASGVPANIAKAFAWMDNDVKQGTTKTIAITSVTGGSTFNTATPHGFTSSPASAIAFSLADGGTFFSSGATYYQVYYVIATGLTSTAFQLSLTVGGPAISVTGGSGVQAGLLGGATQLWQSLGNSVSAANSVYQAYANCAASYTPKKKFILYEGGYQGGPAITTSQIATYAATNNNLTPAYGGIDNNTFGSGGKVYDMIKGWKNSSNFLNTTLFQWNDIKAALVAAGGSAADFIPAWYTSAGASGNYLGTTANCTSSGSTTLTVSATPSLGYIEIGSVIYGTGGIYIVSQSSSTLPGGALGGAGTYVTSAATTLSGNQTLIPPDAALVADYPWAMLETNLYGSPRVFQSYNAMQQWNNT